MTDETPTPTPTPRLRRTRAVAPQPEPAAPTATEPGDHGRPSTATAPTWWWTVAGAAVTLVWLVGAVLTDALPVDVATVSAAAAVGVAVLVTAAWAPTTANVEAILASGAALVVLPTLTAVGLDGFATDPSPALALLAIGVAVLVGATLPMAPPQVRFLVAPALLLAVPAAAALDAATAVVVVAGAAAVAAASWSATAALPLGLLAVAVTAVPDARPAAYLLAAAAVLAAVAPHLGGHAAVLGLPGAVVAAAAVAAGPVSVIRVAATLALAGVTAFATTHPRDPDGDGALRDRTVAPAAALALWLLVLPGTWSWVGDARLHHYDQGAMRALVAAAAALAAREAWVRRRGPVPSTDELP
jgi:hypothetical protein